MEEVNNKRLRSDPNKFIIENQICWILTYNNKGIEKSRTKINIKYKDIIEKSNLKWYQDKRGYIMCDWIDENNRRRQTYLHEAVFDLSGQEILEGYEIDHKDRDKLNNLEENLRICTHAQNCRNKDKFKNNTSGYKGVSWYKHQKKWQAMIKIGNKPQWLGYFNTAKDAARAYNVAAIKYFGEFAVLNII